MVVLADSEASAEIDTYIKNCNAIGDYPGMDSLPAGASSEDKREYTRK
jgi:hypothetical protein